MPQYVAWLWPGCDGVTACQKLHAPILQMKYSRAFETGSIHNMERRKRRDAQRVRRWEKVPGFKKHVG